MKFQCFHFDSISDAYLSYCPTCIRFGSYVPVVRRPGNLGRIVDVGILTAAEPRASGQQRNILPGPWETLFPEGILRPFFIVLFGQPGGGKTSLALLLAEAWPSDALYAPFEEGFSGTLREKITRFSISTVVLTLKNVLSLHIKRELKLAVK